MGEKPASFNDVLPMTSSESSGISYDETARQQMKARNAAWNMPARFAVLPGEAIKCRHVVLNDAQCVTVGATRASNSATCGQNQSLAREG